MNKYCSNNMCYGNFEMPQVTVIPQYRSSTNPNYNFTDNNYSINNGAYPPGDDRFFFAPFLVGGLAGTALGYGIANNNQMKNGGYYMPPPPIYYYPTPTPYTYNNYYY